MAYSIDSGYKNSNGTLLNPTVNGSGLLKVYKKFINVSFDSDGNDSAGIYRIGTIKSNFVPYYCSFNSTQFTIASGTLTMSLGIYETDGDVVSKNLFVDGLDVTAQAETGYNGFEEIADSSYEKSINDLLVDASVGSIKSTDPTKNYDLVLTFDTDSAAEGAAIAGTVAIKAEFLMLG